jgi:mRNA-degrading endonuclease toxin of MazEF toxin-antitoxin module
LSLAKVAPLAQQPGQARYPPAPSRKRTGVRRGELWWADVPPGDPHPVLLLSWDTHGDWRDRVTIAEITRTIRNVDAEVILGPSDGVREICAVNLDNLATIPRDDFLDSEPICALSRERMAEVEIAIHKALGMALPCMVSDY